MTNHSKLNIATTLVLANIISACGGSGGQSHTSAQVPNTQTQEPVSTHPVEKTQTHHISEKHIQLSLARLPSKLTTTDNLAVPPLTEFEKQEIRKAFEFTNRLRKEKGKAPLRYDDNLGAYAQIRSLEAASFPNSLGHHKRPNGDDFDSGLYKNRGGAGENLLGGVATAKQAVLIGWRNSLGHYKNIIDDDYERIGIGLIYKPDSKYQRYWTQIFALGDTRSPYNFANSTKPDPDEAHHLAKHIKIDNQNKITVEPGKAIATSATEGYETEGYYQLTHPIYKIVFSYPGKEYQLLIADPKDSGISYQTFAEIVTQDGIPVQYANIGIPQVPDEHINLNARYTGVSIGNYRQRDHVYADVQADIHYGKDKKSMTVAFSNSKVAPDDIKNNHPAALTRYSNVNFDFSRQLNWDHTEQRFIDMNKENSEHIFAQFYGPDGAEIGGQFVRQINNGTYEGVFAAKKE